MRKFQVEMKFQNSKYCIKLSFFFSLSQAVQVLFAIAIFITYALQSYVPVEIIWSTYLKEKFEKSRYNLLYEYILRTVLVLVTCKCPIDL